MSDDENYYDDEEYLDYDDFPFNEAEDLAVHAVQSPCLFVDSIPLWETASWPSEWEYETDEYWEEGASKRRKQDGPTNNNAKPPLKSKHIGTKRRKDKSNSIPKLSLGEPSLAGSSVVWKSKAETLSDHEGPIVQDGQGEKVSLLTDWKERFKLPTVAGSAGGERKRRQRASDPDSTYPALTEGNTDVLPPPPTSLEEVNTRPAKNSTIIAPLGTLALEKDATAAIPPFEEDPYSDGGFSEPDDVGYSNTSQRVIAVELPSQDIGPEPLLNGKAGRSLDVKIPLTENERETEVNLSEPKESVLPSRKRKRVDKVPSDEDTITTIDEPRKRKRTQKQKDDTTEEPTQRDTEQPPQVEAPARKRGRPKKDKSSPPAPKVNGRIQKPPARPLHKGPAESAPVNSHASRPGKRKLSTSEDELAMPLPKRQTNAKKGTIASAAVSTKEPVARRSSRRK